jgi:hypothetical protein
LATAWFRSRQTSRIVARKRCSPDEGLGQATMQPVPRPSPSMSTSMSSATTLLRQSDQPERRKPIDLRFIKKLPAFQ